MTTEHTPTPLWLSKVDINTRSALAANELRNAKSMINRVMGLFDNPPRQANGQWDRAGIGVLYRIAHGSPTTGAHLLIQSTIEPTAAHLPEDYGSLATRRIDSFLHDLAAGDPVNYRIVLNPVQADDNGRRRVLGHEAADAHWQHLAERAGLTLLAARATREPTLVTGKMHVALRRFDGHATITDTEALRQAVLTGIGPAKSYGAGLLSLA